MADYFYRPSGVTLPLIIRRKLESEAVKQQKNGNKCKSSEESQKDPEQDSIDWQRENQLELCNEWEKDLYARTQAHNDFVQSREDLFKNSKKEKRKEKIGSVFVYEELLDSYNQASSLVSEMQRHLHRGEEAYFDDTNAHGNIFKGWDTFIDYKLPNNGPLMGGNSMGVGGDMSGMGGVAMKGNELQLMGGVGHINHMGISSNSGGSNVKRKMPSDDRWFSSSCSAPRMKHSQSQREEIQYGFTKRPKYLSRYVRRKRNPVQVTKQGSKQSILTKNAALLDDDKRHVDKNRDPNTNNIIDKSDKNTSAEPVMKLSTSDPSKNVSPGKGNEKTPNLLDSKISVPECTIPNVKANTSTDTQTEMSTSTTAKSATKDKKDLVAKSLSVSMLDSISDTKSQIVAQEDISTKKETTDSNSKGEIIVVSSSTQEEKDRPVPMEIDLQSTSIVEKNIGEEKNKESIKTLNDTDDSSSKVESEAKDHSCKQQTKPDEDADKKESEEKHKDEDTRNASSNPHDETNKSAQMPTAEKENKDEMSESYDQSKKIKELVQSDSEMKDMIKIEAKESSDSIENEKNSAHIESEEKGRDNSLNDKLSKNEEKTEESVQAKMETNPNIEEEDTIKENKKDEIKSSPPNESELMSNEKKAKDEVKESHLEPKEESTEINTDNIVIQNSDDPLSTKSKTDISSSNEETTTHDKEKKNDPGLIDNATRKDTSVHQTSSTKKKVSKEIDQNEKSKFEEEPKETKGSLTLKKDQEPPKESKKNAEKKEEKITEVLTSRAKSKRDPKAEKPKPSRQSTRKRKSPFK